MGKTVKSLV